MIKRTFRELIPPFLRDRLRGLESTHGSDSPEYLALARQYVQSPEETSETPEANLRHYEADMGLRLDGRTIPGVERLYRRTLVVEPTLACAAHCRYCIRANYPRHNLTDDQLVQVARYCGDPAHRDDLREVLITGGDVLLVPDRVDVLLSALRAHAQNIRTARIATRIPVQDPGRINESILRLFERHAGLRVEMGTQINHPVELCSETIAALEAVMDRGGRIYAQNVLLRGVNDELEILVELYDQLRDLGIESHYLFHCVPLQGMGHLRTRLDTALDLARGLGSCGEISGRSKPLVAAMTDIGKIVLYDGAIGERDDRHVLLRSRYRLADRRRWNPAWTLPTTATVNQDGFLAVWYLDGSEQAVSATSEFAQHSSPASDARPLPVLSA